MRIELLLFLSFLAILVVLIACSVPRRPTPVLSPTLFPQLTLTMYDPQLVARLSGEAAIAATILPPKPNLPEIDISPPRCYRTISPQLTCLGYLRNATDADLAEISLNARFSGDEVEQAREASFSLEQPAVPAGRRAPYRLQMPDLHRDDAAIEIALASAQLASSESLELTLEDETGRYQPESNSYRFLATLRNSSDASVRDIRLVVTVEDEAGALIAFRAADWSVVLSSGEAMPVALEITPLVSAAVMRHQAIALAQRATRPADLPLKPVTPNRHPADPASD